MENFHSDFIRSPSSRFELANESTGAFACKQAENVDQTFLKTETNQNEKCETFYYSDGISTNRKTFAFWTVISVLFFVTILNICLTLSIIHVLRLGKGINGIELVPREDLIKFYGETDFESVHSRSYLEAHGFKNQPILIESNGTDINVRLYRNGQFMNRMVFDDSGINVRAVNSFELKDAITGNTIFTTHRPQYNIPQGAKNLIAKTISASKIESPLEANLNFEVDGRTLLKGSEGITLDSYGIFLQAENVILNSTQNIYFKNSNIYLNVDKLPFAAADFGLLRSGSASYKICVCMPKGILFRILIPRSYNGPKVSCALINLSFDPCLLL